MKLKFDPTLEYQQDAIAAVVGVFEGQPPAQSNFEISGNSGGGLQLSDLGLGNNIILDDKQILANVRKIQEANDIEKAPELEKPPGLKGWQFSVEMETGTGKTYIYLRTIFELAKNYGLKKFIVVVPSVAVREGVLKSIDVMKDHFCALYDNTAFNYFVYDSKKLGRVRQFASNDQIQIMVINIQSFQKDVPDKDAAAMTEDELKKLNVINRENDRMSGYKPIEYIKATNPIVIIDEPQSVDNTEKAKRAIANLNPIATLRYSATHRNPYNLLYKLDPIRALDLQLVKQIEVDAVLEDGDFNAAFVRLLKTDNTRGIKAKLVIHKESHGNIKPTTLWVKQGDNLYAKSGERGVYREGYIVQHIDCTPGAECIEFSGGRFLEPGGEMGGSRDDIMKAQVAETIEQHLKKERAVKGKNIKILSLFFIDKVANYRVYNEDGTTALGKIGQWFEEAYKEISDRPIYRQFAANNISAIHNGYFSQDKKGRAKDTSGKTAADDDTYNLIMRDKERLLDPEVPLRFIFSHSALREGWDNPNVFQICTLSESRSAEKKRQEIGRGLRLPINKDGERIRDKDINRLTVIANESYDEFTRSLQQELEDECGMKFGRVDKHAFAKIIRIKADGNEEGVGQEESAEIWDALKAAGYINEDGDIQDKFAPDSEGFVLTIDERYNDIKPHIIDVMKRFILKNRVINARERCDVKLNKKVYLGDDFKELWEKIKHRTRYRVSFTTGKLIAAATKRIKNMEAITRAKISATRVQISVERAGVTAGRILAQNPHNVSRVPALPDLLTYLQKETELTRHTLVKILSRSGRLNEFLINPQQFMAAVAREISRALHDLMLDGIEYEKIPNHCWEMRRIEQEAAEGITRYLSNLYKVQNKNKSLFDMVEQDSEVEKAFARDLDNNEHIRLFVKLPGWFKIDTPIGPYNPDWAFVTHRDEKLYFVRETKSTLDKDKLRTSENQKTKCGKYHFDALDINYGVVTELSQVDF